MSNNSKAPLELYDLAQDLGEQNNIANNHPEIVAEINAIMEKEHVTSEVFRFGFEKTN
jgi:hypothetical protein